MRGDRAPARQETYTEFRRVPEKRTFYREECYLEDEVKTQEITQQQCHLVMNPVERKVKVQVPETQWREMPADKDCPNPTPQRCPVTVLREEERTVCLEEPALVWSTTKCQIDYCVKVPKTKKTVCTEDTVWKLEPVEKTAARSLSACPRSSSSRTKSRSAGWCRRPCLLLAVPPQPRRQVMSPLPR